MVLLDVGENRIEVIKAIRAITGLALASIEEFIENEPQNKKQISEEEAQKIKKELEEIGQK